MALAVYGCFELLRTAASIRIGTLDGELALVRVGDRALPFREALGDGPYVVWRGTRATFLRVCHGVLVETEREVGAPTTVPDPCDTGRTYVVDPVPPVVEPDTFVDVSRVLAVSDVHGHYDELVGLLSAGGAIDADLRWSLGDGHLVAAGDVFDRGSKVTESLWLVHQLERQAREAGGRVHFLLGNHELAILRWQFEQVHWKYGRRMLGAVVPIRLPDLYGPTTELGRWLRTKHAAVLVDGVLYSHAGLAPEAARRGYTLQQVNGWIRANLDAEDHALELDEDLRFLFGKNGPFWYRGYHPRWEGEERATRADLEEVLAAFDATAMVVGRTRPRQAGPPRDEIVSLLDGLLVGIATDMELGEPGEALLVEDGHFYRVVGGSRRREPLGSE